MSSNLIFPITLNWSDIGKKLIIDIARLDEAEEIANFLNVHLLRTSPTVHLHNSNGLFSDQDKTKQLEKVCLDYVTACLSCGPYTLTVRDNQTGQLVATRLNRLEHKSSEMKEQFPDWIIFAVLQTLNKDVNLWDKCETDCIFYFCVVTVDEKYGKRGLAKNLNELAIEFAFQSGAGAVAAEAINCSAARVLTKLGFTTVNSLDYATFEFKGVKPLADNVELLSKHPTAFLMVKKLNKN